LPSGSLKKTKQRPTGTAGSLVALFDSAADEPPDAPRCIDVVTTYWKGLLYTGCRVDEPVPGRSSQARTGRLSWNESGSRRDAVSVSAWEPACSV